MQYLLGIAFGLIALLGFGISDIFLVLGAKAYGSVKTAFLFYLVICIASLVPALWLFSLGNFTPEVIGLLAITGVISFVGFASFSKGFEVGDASIVAPIASGWSVVTIMLSILFLNEHLTITAAFEVFLIVLGVVLVSIKYNDIKKLRLSKVGNGPIYGIMTMVSWGFYFFLAAILVFRIGWFDTAFLLNLITLALLLVYGTCKKIKLMELGKMKYWIIIFGGLSQLVALLAYNVGVTLNFTSIISPITSASAMVPVLFGILFLREKPERTQVLGILLIIFSVVVLALQGY